MQKEFKKSAEFSTKISKNVPLIIVGRDTERDKAVNHLSLSDCKGSHYGVDYGYGCLPTDCSLIVPCGCPMDVTRYDFGKQSQGTQLKGFKMSKLNSKLRRVNKMKSTVEQGISLEKGSHVIITQEQGGDGFVNSPTGSYDVDLWHLLAGSEHKGEPFVFFTDADKIESLTPLDKVEIMMIKRSMALFIDISGDDPTEVTINDLFDAASPEQLQLFHSDKEAKAYKDSEGRIYPSADKLCERYNDKNKAHASWLEDNELQLAYQHGQTLWHLLATKEGYNFAKYTDGTERIFKRGIKNNLFSGDNAILAKYFQHAKPIKEGEPLAKAIRTGTHIRKQSVKVVCPDSCEAFNKLLAS